MVYGTEDIENVKKAYNLGRKFVNSTDTTVAIESNDNQLVKISYDNAREPDFSVCVKKADFEPELRGNVRQRMKFPNGWSEELKQACYYTCPGNCVINSQYQ